MLLAKYTRLGARITLIEVEDDPSAQKHKGKLYYFDESSRVKEIAVILAKDSQSTEALSPKYVPPAEKEQVNYAIWIVGKVNTQGNYSPVSHTESNQIENSKVALPKVEAPRQVSKTLTMVRCPKCPSTIRSDRLASHMTKIHHEKKTAIAVTKSRRSSSQTKSKTALDETQSATSKSASKIILISRRGMIIRKRMTCDSCLSTESVLYRYAESSHGIVHICGRCKATIFNRSFDKVDAMNSAFQGGAFETNRRRH